MVFKDDFAGFFGDVGAAEAAHDDFGLALDFAGALVDGEHGENDAVFRKMRRSRMTRSSTTSMVEPESMRMRPAVTLSFFARVGLVEFEDVAVFDDEGVFDGAGLHGELGVAAEVAVVAVNGDEELRADEIDKEAHVLPDSRVR